MSLFHDINSNMCSQTGVWEQGRSPVGRDILIPTSVYVTNRFYRSIETPYANIFCLYGLFLYAVLRRDEGNPTYSFLSLSARLYFMPILFNGAIAIAPYDFLLNQKYDNLPHFSLKLFFNVKMSLCKKWSL